MQFEFFFCFLRMIYKTKEVHAKQFIQTWWEANSECAKLRKALFFPQKTRKKNSAIRKTNTNHSCIYHSIAYKLWNLSLQKTRNQNQSNEKLGIVAKTWKLFLQQTRNQNHSNEFFWNCCKKLGSYLYNKSKTKILIMFFLLIDTPTIDCKTH